MNFSTLGYHIVADFWGVDFQLFNNADWLETRLVEAAEIAGATVCSVQSKQFQPQGATVLVLLSESHLSIHTYPEKGFAALDCYACGGEADTERMIEHLLAVFMPEEIYAQKLTRGQGNIAVYSPVFLQDNN
ncbi:adenosylmethionine decarboxylase [Paenibacillus sp. PAMC21692]|uniref:adenosylmethionine decarboxylase n=1 Tax=Paenibacillus sp. PAMC21692 TaxID=2762320 RepID=UPI00164CE060|nr:adenosylmethionine decarboxylase [Paenibacillus sp. PAMC21692]QNK59545.1 adenosylmethionine decarboxylase [Paenibacillus sp. PAMC21692]